MKELCFFFFYDYSIYMYNLMNLNKTLPMEFFTAPNFCSSSFYIKAEFSPDGHYIASGSKDGHVYLWEVYIFFLPYRINL
jgi:WD40 repeat protein